MTKLTGIPASPGVAIGPAFLFNSVEPLIVRRTIEHGQISLEVARFEEALTQTRRQILDIQKQLAQEMGQDHAEIFNAHLLVLEDRALIEEVLSGLHRDHVNVEFLFSETVKKYIRAFAKIDDEYLKERTADIEDVRKRMLRNLLGKDHESLATLNAPVVVVSYDLSPSDTASMHKGHVLALVTAIGGRTSHTAIMAKSLEIPAVVGLGKATQHIRKGDRLIVDGTHGDVWLDPDEATVAAYEEKRHTLVAMGERLSEIRDLPAETTDGHKVVLSANIELPEELDSVIAHGAEGIGLYRTEFFYMSRTDLPSEEDQFAAYKAVAERMRPHTVIIRTFDLGGDKFLSHLEIPYEMNPFMGWRAIRFCLAQPEIFKRQLRAILRASAFGPLKLMYPMISGVEELLQANQLLQESREELRQQGLAYNEQMPVGAMIEVPSAAMICDLLAKEVQFFSIGTNDLIQYSLAVDRGNEKIAYLYEPAHPGVLRLIKQVIDTGHAHGLWVGMCGEMAGEPALGLILLGMGMDEFSVSPVLVPTVKRMIRAVSRADAEQIATQALTFSTGREVAQFAQDRLRELVPDLPV